MTTVQGEHEISLNGVRFPIIGEVRSSIASVYPEKRVEGDFTRDSQRNVSVLAIADVRGGVGRREFISGETNRAWFSQLNTRHEGHLTLQSKPTQTAAGPNFNPLISELGGSIVAAHGTDVRQYSEGGDSWGGSLQTLGATPTDVTNGTLVTTEYLVFAIGTGYEYSSSSATWATSAKDALNIVFWSERFWGIDATGQLWYTFTMGSAEVDDALLPVDLNDAITGLFTGRDAFGNVILYVSTTKSLWAHDLGNRQFVKTSVFLSGNSGDAAERVSLTWRDNIYLGSSQSVNEYKPGTEATYREMGFTIPDGTPSAEGIFDFEQTISCMASSALDLLAGGNPIGSLDLPGIWAWNGVAWQLVWQGATTTQTVYSMHVSNSGGIYRLWWANIRRVFHMVLPLSSTPSKQIDGFVYKDVAASGSVHEYPIFSANQKEITKIALVLRVEVEGIVDQNDGVKVFVQIDGGGYVQRTDTHTSSSNFSAANDDIESDGITIFSFPSVAAPAGTEFKTIQIRVDLIQGATETNSPDIRSVTLEYLKVLDEKLAFDFVLDFTQPWGGKSPNELRSAYLTAQALKTLPEFVYRGTSYYVKVLAGQGDELTGNEQRGHQLVRCEQP